jgi:hypothetical protein
MVCIEACARLLASGGDDGWVGVPGDVRQVAWYASWALAQASAFVPSKFTALLFDDRTGRAVELTVPHGIRLFGAVDADAERWQLVVRAVRCNLGNLHPATAILPLLPMPDLGATLVLLKSTLAAYLRLACGWEAADVPRRLWSLARHRLRGVDTGRSFDTECAMDSQTALSLTCNMQYDLSKCGRCGRADAELMQCGRCHSVAYCGGECAAANWAPRHRGECRGLAADRDQGRRTGAVVALSPVGDAALRQAWQAAFGW